MLILLASYPKSGNTWLRAVLSNYYSGLQTAVPINSLFGSSILSQRHHLDEEVGIDSSNLTDDESDNWRPWFCRAVAKEIREPTFIKIHDAYSLNQTGKPLFPADAVDAVVYPVRNPLQVCVSYAHHQNESLEWAIDHMMNDDALLFREESHNVQLRQKLMSWSGHVSSWLDQSEIPVHPVRYEDLSKNPLATVSRMMNELGLCMDPDRLDFALRMSGIEELQQQELNSGFAEKNPNAKSFFRSGSVDDWKDRLTQQQIDRIKNHHHVMMERLGYL